MPPVHGIILVEEDAAVVVEDIADGCDFVNVGTGYVKEPHSPNSGWLWNTLAEEPSGMRTLEKKGSQETHHPTPQSEGSDPQSPSLLQQFPNTTLQVYPISPPHVPSGVFPDSHGNGAGVVTGLVQLPAWQLLIPQKSSPVPQAPSKLQQSPHLPAQRRKPWSKPQVPSVL